MVMVNSITRIRSLIHSDSALRGASDLLYKLALSGQTYWWLVPKINTNVMTLVFADFAAHFEVGPKRCVLMVMDQAGFHTSEKLKISEGMDVLFLPPRSPELQPAERLWPWTNEAIVNRHFETLDELEEVTVHRCRALLEQPDFVKGLTGFHWWLDSVSQSSLNSRT
ncbi:MAG: transposase [Cyanobacteria bacterium P01_C01_bin.89]